ncbi:hypothetical protein [Streptomyces coeruleorubidus]|uniref:hypothetical protein n=1 Tax=Streptomyces coeruleorubidus TaxID=116188 RepID=UPI003665CF8E
MPAGETVTVRFDTHHLLNNADSWQPSLVTEVVADDAVPLDRRLVPVGQFADTARGIDVLAANLLASAVEGQEYAVHATTRLSEIKAGPAVPPAHPGSPPGALHGAGRRLMGHT